MNHHVCKKGMNSVQVHVRAGEQTCAYRANMIIAWARMCVQIYVQIAICMCFQEKTLKQIPMNKQIDA